MRRVLLAFGVLLMLTITGCGGSSKSASSTSSSTTKVEPANITIWTPFVDPELITFKKVVKDFETKNPGIHVKVIGGTNDDKIVAAIRGGNAPDVAQSFTSDNTGVFCPSGAWIDLGPYMQKDGVKDSIFPGLRATTRSSRGSAARCRCSPTPTVCTTTRRCWRRRGTRIHPRRSRS